MKPQRFLAVILSMILMGLASPPVQAQTQDLWALGQAKKDVHAYSTLFTAQNVREHLSTPEGIDKAIDWCKKTAVTRVFIETFRGTYWADKQTLIAARDRFRTAGIAVSGCVTTTRVGKDTTGWKNTISCYTDLPTQATLKKIFEHTAALFDEIMIDDFWFTDCACPLCDAARAAKTVTIGDRKFPVAGDTFEDYRCELLVQLSRLYILEAARKVNPQVKIIIKYPQWYDNFHERGYEVVRETADFDRTWVGTETRDYADKRWGGHPQYEAYFIMRWLGAMGGEKCGGGWFDPYGTTEATYLEQARQTVLAGARESTLFCYGSLQQETGPKNIEALRANIPELLEVAGQVRKREPVCIALYKPANSHPEKEKIFFSFIGMLGLPLVPCHEFPADAPAAIFSIHALKDPEFAAKLAKFTAAGKPVLLTDGLVEKLDGMVTLKTPYVQVLAVKGAPKSLMDLPQDEIDAIRAHLLKPMGVSFAAPNHAGLYLFKDGSWVIENFNDAPAPVMLNGKKEAIAPRGWKYEWK